MNPPTAAKRIALSTILAALQSLGLAAIIGVLISSNSEQTGFNILALIWLVPLEQLSIMVSFLAGLYYLWRYRHNHSRAETYFVIVSVLLSPVIWFGLGYLLALWPAPTY